MEEWKEYSLTSSQVPPSSITLTPIHPLQSLKECYQLPSLSDLQLPTFASKKDTTCCHTSKVNIFSFESDHYSSAKAFVPPLSTSTSFSSLTSASSSKVKKSNFLSRAATRRRGRPKQTSICISKYETIMEPMDNQQQRHIHMELAFKEKISRRLAWAMLKAKYACIDQWRRDPTIPTGYSQRN